MYGDSILTARSSPPRTICMYQSHIQSFLLHNSQKVEENLVVYLYEHKVSARVGLL